MYIASESRAFCGSMSEMLVTLNTHTHLFNGPLSGTTRVSRYQKDKTNLDFTEARDSGRQWHQLGHMQICTSIQTNNHSRTPPLSFLQAGCLSCRPTNSVKALTWYEGWWHSSTCLICILFSVVNTAMCCYVWIIARVTRSLWIVWDSVLIISGWWLVMMQAL